MYGILAKIEQKDRRESVLYRNNKNCMQHRTAKIKPIERTGNFKRKMKSGFWHTETYSNSKYPKEHCLFSM